MNTVIKLVISIIIMAPVLIVAQYKPHGSNKVQLTSQAELNGYLKAHPVVVMYVFREDCHFCQSIKPAMQQLVAQMQDVFFVYVDGDYNMLNALVDKYAPEGFPEIKIFKNGQVVKSMGDNPTKASIEAAIRRYTN